MKLPRWLHFGGPRTAGEETLAEMRASSLPEPIRDDAWREQRDWAEKLLAAVKEQQSEREVTK